MEMLQEINEKQQTKIYKRKALKKHYRTQTVLSHKKKREIREKIKNDIDRI